MLPERIETARLSLRCWAESDAEALRAALDQSDAHLRPWILFMRDEPRSLDGTRERLRGYVEAFERGEHYHYAITRSGRLLGSAMLLDRVGPDAIELGYWLAVDAVGHGYATEASAPLIEHAFDALGRERVILRCDERNAASLRVAERLGAAPVGREVESDDVTLVVLERRR